VTVQNNGEDNEKVRIIVRWVDKDGNFVAVLCNCTRGMIRPGTSRTFTCDAFITGGHTYDIDVKIELCWIMPREDDVPTDNYGWAYVYADMNDNDKADDVIAYGRAYATYWGPPLAPPCNVYADFNENTIADDTIAYARGYVQYWERNGGLGAPPPHPP